MKVKPENTGSFKFYVKSVAGRQPDGEPSAWDPTSGTKDQQNEYVKIYTINVREPPRVHNINTGEDFYTIQEAIDDPDTKDGHTIVVDPGSYYFRRTSVYKSLTIKSYSGNPEDTIIHLTFSDACFYVTTDDVKIEGFYIQGKSEGYVGIMLSEVKNCEITNNLIKNCEYGIMLSEVKNCEITNNLIKNCDTCISLKNSKSNIIKNNIVEGKIAGIFLIGSSDNYIETNSLINNKFGIYL